MRATIIGINFPPEPTGIAPYTGGAADGLAAAGTNVHVITGYPHYPQWEIADGYTGLRIRELRGPVRVERLRHPVARGGSFVQRIVMEVTFGLRAILANWRRPSAVLAVSPAFLATLLVVLRATLTRTPVVVWVQDVYTLSVSETGTHPRFAGIVRLLESRTLRWATRVLVIHPRVKRYVCQTLGVPEHKVDVVRNWTHTQPSPARSAQVRRRFGWDDDETVVLHAGNMGVKQNLRNVVEAAQLAADTGVPVRFVLLGDGNCRHELEQQSPNACLQFLDPLPDGEFEEALASADILLVNELPGMTEMSMPSKLTTYFNTGLPVLAAVDTCSVSHDEVERAGGGIQVPPGDPEALLDAVLQLAGDDGLRADLGAAGQQYRDEVLGAEAAIEAIITTLAEAARLTAR